MVWFNVGNIGLDDKTAKKVQTLMAAEGMTIQELVEHCVRVIADIHVQDNGNVTRLSDKISR